MSLRVASKKNRGRRKVLDDVQIGESHEREGSPNVCKQQIIPRPLPEEAALWHRGNVHCVKITSDGDLIVSAGADCRLIVSKVSSGNVVYHLNTYPNVATSVAWLGIYDNKRRLAAGCDDGSVLVWSLGSCMHERHVLVHKYEGSITMLDYDLASESLLVALEASCALLVLKRDPTKTCDVEANTLFNCSGVVGGVGFLAFGVRCVLSVPSSRSLTFLSTGGNELTLEQAFDVEYEPHYITVSSDSFSFAVGGLDGSIHIYNWKQHPSPFEMAVISYPRIYRKPRSITFSFINGSHFILVGSEEEHAFLYDVLNNRKVAHLSLQEGCSVHSVTTWTDLERVRLVTASCGGRYYIALWECLLADLRDVRLEFHGKVSAPVMPFDDYPSIDFAGNSRYKDWLRLTVGVCLALIITALISVQLRLSTLFTHIVLCTMRNHAIDFPNQLIGWFSSVWSMMITSTRN